MKNNELAKSTLASAIVLWLIAVVLYALLSPEIAVVSASTNAIGANVPVPNTCIPIVANKVINFGQVLPGSYASTANAENVLNFGNAASNIFIMGGSTTTTDNGGNWAYLSNTFLYTNTLWDLIPRGANNGNQIGNFITNPQGQDTFAPASANGGSNAIFFGVNVPAFQAPSGASSYSATIDVMLSC